MACFAHPMGNFSINHYSKIRIARGSIEIRYVIDMAEIPTFQAMRDQTRPQLKEGLSLELDGVPVSLDTISREVTYTPGAGGLNTMKIALVFRSQIKPAADHNLFYSDNNFPGRAGWKEIVVVPEGVELMTTSAPATDRSQELTTYSTDALTSPPQLLTAQAAFRFAPRRPRRITSVTKPAPQIPPTVVPAPATPRSKFTELIATRRHLSFWFLLSAALIAAGLGALHALEPGHGKTMVAAYLVGSRGTAKHAVFLGLVVTAAHTAGVYLLGALTLYASRYIVPERLYPWLGAISGLTVAGLGIFIFLKHWTGETANHGHKHWFNSQDIDRQLSLRQLCILGITGGIVPCPAALVVLLSAFSLHRIGLGLFLITAFSLGLAAVLVIIGLTMVYAKRAISSRISDANPFLRYLPFLSSAFMVILGIGIVASAATPIHVTIAKDKLIPFVTVILLGLFLGMRHSTDADHVVAVSTIVSRQGSIKSSATIGLLWGLGHTLTIFLVGSAIIVFGFVIPPRLGLSMEFCVALMLILLGILNLTGALRWITDRLTPTTRPQIGSPLRRVPSGRAFARMPLGLYQTIRPFAVGLVHGLAGSAAVALLVLSTIRSPLWSTAYLLVFGLGTMLGMMLMTAAISVPLIYTGKRFTTLNRYMIAASGVASVAFGMFLVYQIGFVDGLFRSHVHWIPQ